MIKTHLPSFSIQWGDLPVLIHFSPSPVSACNLPIFDKSLNSTRENYSFQVFCNNFACFVFCNCLFKRILVKIVCLFDKKQWSVYSNRLFPNTIKRRAAASYSRFSSATICVGNKLLLRVLWNWFWNWL